MDSVPGLMDSTAMTPPGGVPGAPPPDDTGDEQGAPASPQEEAQMEQFLAQCKLAVYDPKHPEATKALIASLKASGNPVQALAHASVNIVMRVEDAATQGGEKLDPAVLLQGGYVVVDDVAKFSTEVSKAQGTPSFNDKQTQAAYLVAVDLYRTMKQKSGTLDDGAAKQEWGQLKQADQSGDLGKVLPGANDLKDTQAAGGAAPASPAAAPGLAKRKKKRRR